MAAGVLSFKGEIMKKRIYISGPMTGFEDYNYPAFHKEAGRLRAMGHVVESPAENKPPLCGTWAGYLKQDIVQLLKCNCIATLPGWRKSKGARLEVYIAKALGIEVRKANGIKR